MLGRLLEPRDWNLQGLEESAVVALINQQNRVAELYHKLQLAPNSPRAERRAATPLRLLVAHAGCYCPHRSPRLLTVVIHQVVYQRGEEEADAQQR